MLPRLSRLLVFALLAVAGTSATRAAEGGEAASCLYAPAPPAQLVAKDAITDYQSVLRTCRSADGRAGLAIRAMTIAETPILLLADPQKLSTRLERAACWTCQETSEDSLADSRMMRAVAQSAEAPGLVHRGFLQNAGLTHGAAPGAFVTGDLCPSRRPLDRPFFDKLASQGPHTPVALSISGLWLVHHFQDYRWLLDKQAAGALDILWVDHTYHHPYRRGEPNDHNFLLTKGVDPDAEILDTERLLIANSQTPSLFFRFPGLISNAPLMQAVRRHHLISLGADAWLALNQRPGEGSIVLVHPNGNEEAGLALFDREIARGAIARPLEPLIAAPN
ncbi:MAG: polysaccharide deacetylase [Roseiarcus sp.]